MKIALVTLAEGDHCHRLADLVREEKQAYCRRYGYEFIEFHETLDARRPTAWSKILAVLRVLPQFDWVCWCDSDTLIWDAGLGLRRFCASLQDEVLVFQDDPVGLNSGVFLARNDPRTFQFLATAYDQTQFNGHFLWEQIAIQHLLENTPHRVPHVRIPLTAMTSALQSIYNFHAQPWSGLFLHLAGMRSDHRLNVTERLVRLAKQPMSERLYHRNNLGDFLNSHGLLGEGVEVGVADASYSETILNQWEGRRLHLVDLWSVDPRNRDQSQVPDQLQQSRRIAAEQKMARFGDRVCMHASASVDAAQRFKDESLDFVYLDADHSEEAVLEDIQAWLPKVRRGGLIAGHDFLDGTTSVCHFAVRTAIAKWEQHAGYQVASTAEAEFASWYCFKK